MIGYPIMCRLLGIAANEPTEFKIVLREAPRSLAALSREHRDGWGIAVFDACAATWRVEKGVACAGEDERFHRLAIGTRGELLVSHIRQKTIGDTSLVNTHPFERGRWIFAHNGTVKDVHWLRANASAERLAEIAGETDSELLFAWMLTRLDEVGVAASPAGAETDRALGAIARAGRERPGFGAFNFLLSDGATTYAHRFGRSMFLLERHPEDVVVSEPDEPGRHRPRDALVPGEERCLRRLRAHHRRALADHRGRHPPAHRASPRAKLAPRRDLNGLTSPRSAPAISAPRRRRTRAAAAAPTRKSAPPNTYAAATRGRLPLSMSAPRRAGAPRPPTAVPTA